MNKKQLEQFESRMRYAYTKACVAWPRVNPRPIAMVLSGILADVPREKMDDLVNSLVFKAGTDLRNEKAVKAYVSTLPVADKRPLLSFLLGLDASSMRQVYQESLTGNYAKARASRNMLLLVRRNLLAVALVHTAAEEAQKCLT